MTFASVAILVDGDNISSAYAGQILRKSRDLGHSVKRLVYGNGNAIQGWSAAQSFRTVLVNGSKNGADILLSIQAMEFALRDGIEAFVLVSSDGDLSHIAFALCELKRHVLGLGEEKAPKGFRFACSSFDQLKPLAATVPDKDLGRIDLVVRDVLKAHDPDRKGLPVSRINGLVRNQDKSIMISRESAKTWPKHLAAHPDLYELLGNGGDRSVRIAARADDR